MHECLYLQLLNLDRLHIVLIDDVEFLIWIIHL